MRDNARWKCIKKVYKLEKSIKNRALTHVKPHTTTKKFLAQNVTPDDAIHQQLYNYQYIWTVIVPLHTPSVLLCRLKLDIYLTASQSKKENDRLFSM